VEKGPGYTSADLATRVDADAKPASAPRSPSTSQRLAGARKDYARLAEMLGGYDLGPEVNELIRTLWEKLGE